MKCPVCLVLLLGGRPRDIKRRCPKCSKEYVK